MTLEPPRRSRTVRTISSVCVAALCVFGAATARAEDHTPTHGNEPGVVQVAPAVDLAVIEVWGERPEKPFDRDTELRLTGDQLAELGATNLAEALALLPDIDVREAGRGGQQIDIRGARKGSVKILIDGISVGDPYYGNFDVSSIPVTDIVQIRVSTSPSSPIDGAGGPGGVIEVHTRDAVGDSLVAASVQGTTLPSASAAATGRAMVTDTLAMRVSATGDLGSRDFSMPSTTLDEDRQNVSGAARLEYRKGTRRVVTDAVIDYRSYVVAPGEDGLDDILVIDGESAGRIGVTADDYIGDWRLQGRAYAHLLTRESTYYVDPQLEMVARTEDIDASRAGVGAVINHPIGRHMQYIASAVIDTESADVAGFDGMTTGGRASVAELATGFQLERGNYRVDAAGGIAAPIGIDADPWPELKIVASYAPARQLELTVTGARKGRVPTLRERFRLDIGNVGLGPEQATFGEVAVAMKPATWLAFDVAGYLRETNGLIRFDGDLAELVNTGDLSIRGIDTKLTITPSDAVTGGVAWEFTDAYSPDLGTQPLDHLAANRGSAWLQLSFGAGRGVRTQARYVGDRIDRNQTLPAYTTYELSAFARLRGDLFATVRVDNLLDERHELRIGGVRAPGRVIMLSLRGSFNP